MQLYPAYTVRRIRDELSWRQVGELMSAADRNLSSWQLLNRLEKVAVAYTGAKFSSARPMKDDELLAAIQSLPLAIGNS